MRDSIIADSVHMGIGLTKDSLDTKHEGSGNTHINRVTLTIEEVAILFAAHHNREEIPIKLFNATYLIKMGEPISYRNIKLKRGEYKEVMKEIKEYWMDDALGYISSSDANKNKKKQKQKKNKDKKMSKDEKIFKRTIIVKEKVAGKKKSQFRASLDYYVQPGDNDNIYFLNIQGSPNKILTGDNVSPLFTSDDPIEKARLFTELFSLPAKIVLEILKYYVIKGWDNLNIQKQFNEELINIHRIQLAGYSPKFLSGLERTLAIRLMYNVFHKEALRGESKGVMIGNALGLALERNTEDIKRDKKTYNYDSISGFLIKKKYGKDPFVSLGFYAKNEEEKENNSSEHNANRDAMEAYLNQSLRLDLTIHSEGIRRLYSSKEDRRQGSITQKDVRIFLEHVFTEDINAQGLFKRVLTEELYLDQIFAVSKKQWKKAFSLLDDYGYFELIETLKTRATRKPSWAELCAKQNVVIREFNEGKAKKDRLTIIEPFRLKSLIMEETAEKKVIELDVGKKSKKEIEIAIPGVDLTLPYKLFLEAKNTSVDTYLDPEVLSEIFDDDSLTSNSARNELAEAAKRASEDGLLVYRLLLSKGLETVKTVRSLVK